MITYNILLVGCGKMGGALLDGLLSKVESAQQILVIEPNYQGEKREGVCIVKSIEALPEDFTADLVLFAVKPQMLESILPAFTEICKDDALFISVAAGKNVSFYRKYLGEGVNIVRAMPNLPALVGKGATVLYSDNASSRYKSRAEEFFKCVGTVFWIDDESMLDAVTAISGSGPAYVFYFMECLISAGVKLGLPKGLAKELAYSTVNGSAQLAEESDKSIKELKDQVISPKGTTQAGLNVLEGGLQDLIEKTTKAASNRSRELSV